MVLTARREPRLLMATATLHDGLPVVHLPDGRALGSGAELSQWLDRPVELVAANSTPGTFENPRDVETEDDWHSWQGPIGSFHDGPRVSMVSLDSLADFEPKRFRINLLLDHADGSGASDDDAASEMSETSLVDRGVTIGSVGLHVRSPISRCIMITRAQPGIEADLGVFKRLAREHDNRMGVGADVYREGRLAVGDVVHPLPD
jgi:uncharacterized protein YcbX